jgi:hypothetical protein
MSRAQQLGELTCGEYVALSEEELKAINAIGLTQGTIDIDRLSLARILNENDRLRSLLECSIWLIEEMISAGMVERIHKENPEPSDLERAVFALRFMIEACLENKSPDCNSHNETN